MSPQPIAFKLHVTHIISVLKHSDELCTSIFQNRRTGSKHESLDRLQLGLKASTQAIQNEYSALRKVFGSRFDLGDDLARDALKDNIRTMEDIERRLSDIASRRNDGLPGFREMLKTVQRVEDSVADHLAALGQRLERPAPPPTPKPAEKKVEKPKKSDEIVISVKEWDRYVQHLKNSWSESLVQGRILYVNAFDESKNTWEKPRGGFIKTLPIRVVPEPTTKSPVFTEERRPRDTSPIRRTTRDDRRSSRRYEDEQWARGAGW